MFRRKRYDTPMFRSILFGVLLLSAIGCQFNRSFAPISPGHIFSNEQSRLGIVALEQGHLAEAEKRLEEAVKWNKNDINHRQRYADILWEQGKYQEALQQLSEAVKRGGQDNASLHISIAEKHLAMREFAIAERHANTAVRLAPQDHRSWALRGRTKQIIAMHRAGFTEHSSAMLNEARMDYLRAVSLAPNDAELLKRLAEVQMACGQAEQALATWLTVQNFYPQGGEPLEVLLGKTRTLAMLNRHEEAEAIRMARGR